MVVVLVAVEIARSGSLAGHHHVVTTAVVTVDVSDTAHDRQLVGDGRDAWQDIGDLDAGGLGRDGVEVATDFRGRVGLDVPHVLMRLTAQSEQEDAVDVPDRFALRLGERLLHPQQLGQAKATQAADGKHFSPVQAVAVGREPGGGASGGMGHCLDPLETNVPVRGRVGIVLVGECLEVPVSVDKQEVVGVQQCP